MNNTRIDRARVFMLKRHKLFFDRLENLTVGSNFIHSAAAFADAETQQLESRIAELEAALKEIDAACTHTLEKFALGGLAINTLRNLRTTAREALGKQ